MIYICLVRFTYGNVIVKNDDIVEKFDNSKLNIVTYIEAWCFIGNIYIILDGLEGDTRIYCQRC